MSHTIGQAKENNQQSTPRLDMGSQPAHPSQSNSNSSQAEQDSPQPELTTLKSEPPLSDADYEFLFNQLLAGIAHGWHDQRIIKFFKQLGERGLPSDWCAWLDRVCPKFLKLPTQSRQQLGTVMMRLGELTQAAPEVNQIGAISHRIGRELLFGNGQATIWEYAGSDLTVTDNSSSLETEQELSARLPLDFEALNSKEIGAKDSSSTKATMVELSSEIADPETTLESSVQPNGEQKDTLETLPADSAPENTSPPDITVEDMLSETDPAQPEVESTVEFTAANSGQINSYGEEFEFESEEPDTPQAPDNLTASENIASEVPLNQPANQTSSTPIEGDTQLPVTEQQPELTTAPESEGEQPVAQPPTLDLQETSPVAIDMEQVMNLIQEDAEIAQQISAKLNLTEQSAPTTGALNPSTTHPSNVPNDPSMELVESWFNLGLKHVSAGEFDKAIAAWEKALKINPNLSEAWHNRGSALGRLGRYEAAVESFQSALTIDPNNYQAWNDRAHALYQLQDWAEAVESWSNAIKIMPGNHLFWYNRGCALEQLEKWTEAIASYEKALEIKPDFQPGRSRYINLVADSSRSN